MLGLGGPAKIKIVHRKTFEIQIIISITQIILILVILTIVLLIVIVTIIIVIVILITILIILIRMITILIGITIKILIIIITLLRIIIVLIILIVIILIVILLIILLIILIILIQILKTDFYSSSRWLKLEAPGKMANSRWSSSRSCLFGGELQDFVVRRGLSLKLQEKGKLKMKLQQVFLFSQRAPWLCGPKGSPTRFELKCSKRARFERFLQCSRASVKKHVSSPQPAGLSLKLQEKRQINDEALADLAF
jgi:hypothetical protein